MHDMVGSTTFPPVQRNHMDRVVSLFVYLMVAVEVVRVVVQMVTPIFPCRRRSSLDSSAATLPSRLPSKSPSSVLHVLQHSSSQHLNSFNARSAFISSCLNIGREMYQILNVLENNFDAVLARIYLVQNSERRSNYFSTLNV